ncbi:cytochrome b561 domain-containing protein [Populus alba x Populus x berolinensis]|uniref:Cytochrome b561 domain-containing protein n=2 Tax=Populus TaxID=3689 RepID=A0A4U5R648_POPAL|nr:cytochrome b561 domain-containing protein At2g30890-like [Populus alba]KAJ6953936.1 cytochrome b561 domain-containing protein [Populus alba x Populus x berolinensis]KAJ7006305.1 cytochrome b561 domain-containing protein [Populus alba x Populus x berolinensis]TKS18067.1 hypothetical protein D5086_0000009160 [Populus alba]
MQLLQKLVSFTICASLVILLLLPFVISSQEHLKTTGNLTSNKNIIHKSSPKLLFEITLHGFLLWTSMGFLMPVGVIAIRMSHREACGRRLKILFYVHSISQMLSVLLSTAGAVMSIKNFNNSFDNHHQRIGVGLYGMVWLQALIGFLRPRRGSKGRGLWFFVHWITGTAVSLLGIVNVYTGLQAYHQKTSRRIHVWTIVFTTEVSFIILFYLFQDKWDYIHKQGVILEPLRPTHQVISPGEKKKGSTTESC